MKLGYWMVLFALGLVFAFMIFLDLSQKPPLDWTSSFHRNETSPLGSKIIFELLKNNGYTLKEVNIPPHEFLSFTEEKGVYFFYNSSVSFSRAALDTLLDWVGKGNTAFISAASLPVVFEDTLAFSIKNLDKDFMGINNVYLEISDGFYPNQAEYPVLSQLPIDYIEFDATFDYRILGESKVTFKEEGKPPLTLTHFIEIPSRKGRLFIHSLPVVFSNYFLLEERNLSYMEALFMELGEEPTIFHDNFYKDGRRPPQSPLYVLVQDRSLRMAYYCVLFLGISWVVFEGKRKQRVIPVQKKVKNISLDFAGTLAQMYKKRKGYASLVNHQLTYFKEFVSSRYKIQLDFEEKEGWIRLSEKSGRPEKTVREEMFQLSKIRQSSQVTENDLIQVNKIVTTYTHE